MKKSILVVLCLFVTLPLHAQELAFNYTKSSEPSLSEVESFPQIWTGVAFVAIDKKGGSLFHNLAYPRIAKKAGIEAECEVRFTVSDKAKVEHLEVSGESCEYFEEVLEESLESKSWRPAVKEGRPVDFEVKSSILFNLN